MKATYDGHYSLTVNCQAFNRIFCSARIVLMPSHYLPVQNGVFDIEDIKIVFRHFFDGVNGQIVVS